MITNANIWLIDSEALARMHRVNTTNWNVLEVINDRFFVVKGSVLYQVQRAGYTGAGVEPLGASDIEAVRRLNSLFSVVNTWHYKKP